MCVVTFTVLVVSATAWPHGTSIDILVGTEGKIAPYLFPSGIPILSPAELAYAPIADRILADSPGLGIVNEANGVAANTLFTINVISPLIHWDTTETQRSTASMTIASPQGQEFEVTGDSEPQSGINWGVYPGGTFWDEHGLFFIDPLDAHEGLYGVWLEIDSPSYTVSDEILIPFVYDPQDHFSRTTINTGVAQLLGYDWTSTSLLQGDFNQDGQLSASDIDALSAAIRDDIVDLDFDLNDDTIVDDDDRVVWVEQLAETYFGDANLDGEFNSTDLIEVLQHGEYEDTLVGNSGWSTGDWTGDGEFDTTDLVRAFQAAGYEQGPRAAVAAVPEPNGIVLLTIAMATCLRHVRQRREGERH